ncbi:hypothetical protein [Fannyhessea vaginae]|uniref:hypothetical protein n=1 Tax=Fannyhessea vaginae TaxID=82135 RepID=UPI0028895D9E|nr:hypothetical protein [Fannyhessea vaginae]
MAVTCVDGQGTSPHITGADKGRLHAGVFGEKSVVLAVGKRLEATQEGYNRITIAPGDASLHGRQVSVTAPEQVTITSGTQGQNRSDFICLKYERNAQGIESAKLEVLRGVPTSGKAVDPLVPAGNVLNGDAQDYFPLYRVKLNGVVASKPEQLFIIADTLYKENTGNFEIVTLQELNGYKNYWHIYRTGDSVTINVRGWLSGNSHYDATKCPFTLPEGSRPPLVDHDKYGSITDGYESIICMPGFCPGNAGVITSISARPNGDIWLQDQGGEVSHAWRYASLTYTVSQ